MLTGDFKKKKEGKTGRYSFISSIKSQSIKNEANMEYNKKGGLVITKDSVYEYDMDCLKKNKKCY